MLTPWLRAKRYSRRMCQAAVRRGSNRVKRGGSWNNTANNCRAANRNNNTPGNRNNNLGLRLASTPQRAGEERFTEHSCAS
jgi:formylglycine-generating enzyme required for sulfatase activity